LRLQADLLAAQEDIRELRAELQRAQEDLANTREALEAERARNGANAEEFRQALATVRKSAEEALAVERTAVQQLGNDVREAHELVAARDAAVADLRAKLEAAASDQAEVSRLRERVTVLEAAAHEADALRERLSALEADATETQRLRDHLAGTHKAVAEAYTDVEAVLARLASVRDAVSEGGGDPSSA
jgi:chromosome segregation ATPase